MSRTPHIPKQNPDLIFETIENETIIVHLKSGTYYSLRDVGTIIWTELEAGRTLHEIRTRLVGEYDAAPQEIETGIQQLVESLVEQELLVFEEQTEGSPLIEPASAPRYAAVTTKQPFQTPRLQKFTDMQELLLLDPIHEVDETGWPHTANKDNSSLPH